MRSVSLVTLLAALGAVALVKGSAAVFTATSGTGPSSFTTASDWVPPAVTLTTPADGLFTNDTTPTIAGAAGNATGDSTTVVARIYAGSTVGGTPNQTRNVTRIGAAWTTTATTLANGTYTAQATQGDTSGNTGTSAARTFTVDTVLPTATAIAAANGSGNAGRLDAGDTITFTYSEPILPASVLTGFSGTAMAIQVRFTNNTTTGDPFTLLDSGGGTSVRLESGVSTRANFVTGTATFAATMTRSADGRSFSVVLGAVSSGSSNIRTTAVSAANMIWTPRTGPTDRAANALTGVAAVTESDTDRDF